MINDKILLKKFSIGTIAEQRINYQPPGLSPDFVLTFLLLVTFISFVLAYFYIKFFVKRRIIVVNRPL